MKKTKYWWRNRSFTFLLEVKVSLLIDSPVQSTAYTMPEIGYRFLNFFLSADDFSTCKKNNGSLLNIQDNWIGVTKLTSIFLHFLYHRSLIYAFASLFPDCWHRYILIVQEHKVTLAGALVLTYQRHVQEWNVRVHTSF